MPISNSYPKGVPIEDQDLFVGTKGSNNRTVNYTAQGVADYLNINSKVAIGGQMSFQFTVVPNIPKTIAFEGGLGDGTAFSAITKLVVSAIDLSTANITIFLNYLNNSQVLLSQQNQPNFFGHYKITGYTQIGTSAFYELDLEFIGGNGTIGNKQYYDLVSFVLSAEGAVPNLQEVTDVGNTTSNDIISSNINNSTIIGNGTISVVKNNYESALYIEGDQINFTTNRNNNLKGSEGIGDITLYFPTKVGDYTIATLEDIPGTPTLDQVLIEGNTTTASAIFGDPLNDCVGISSSGIGIVNTAEEKQTSIGAGQVQVADNDFNFAEVLPNGFSVGNLVVDGNAFLNGNTLSISDGVTNSGLTKDYLFFQNQEPLNPFVVYFDIEKLTTSNGEYLYPTGASSPLATLADIPSGGVTSVGLTMPPAFTVTNSPITSSGDIAVTGAGLVSQYVRGDGTLANFPTSTGGGSSVNYYLNGSVSQGTFGGTTYYQMSKTPILGAGTNFTRTNGAGNGYIASFITDAGDPSFLNIPGGNWNLEFYFQSSASGGSPQFYGEIYKVSATNVFTLIASGSANPEGITNGTTVDQYFTSVPVPQTSLLVTDRLAIRIYVITGGRTITLHTENGNLCEVLTTFTTGLTALNGLTDQVQFFDVGTGATNFNISSSGDTHTFNLLFNIRRNANNSSNNNINYNGYAVTGSAESSAVWTITRLTIAASGSITTATATNVAWTNRESAIYT